MIGSPGPEHIRQSGQRRDELNFSRTARADKEEILRSLQSGHLSLQPMCSIFQELAPVWPPLITTNVFYFIFQSLAQSGHPLSVPRKSTGDCCTCIVNVGDV
uniref:Uncharacterized protein n=1 Tax=Timema shepardi TaxID=629360 RepID=A0A7R9BCH1_TIMSH|nr:unnamed protein product [Timema shepardi]